MKLKMLSVGENKFSVFNFFSLIIHTIFTPPLLPADKIQQIKILKTALLLQRNILTLTGVKHSFGITLPKLL